NSSPDYLTLWFALGKIGAVEAPINTAYRGEILRHQLRTSGAVACVVDEAYAGVVGEVVDATAVRRLVVRGEVAATPPGVEVSGFGDLLAPGISADLAEDGPAWSDI